MACLVQQLRTETNEDRLNDVVAFIGMIGVNARSAVPALLDCMDAESSRISMAAADALKHVDPINGLFLAKLKEKLKSPRLDIRAESAKRLLELDPGNREIRSVLLDVLRENLKPLEDGRPWRSVTVTALDSLVRAGSAARDTLPALRQIVIDHPDLYRPPDDIISQAVRHIEIRIKMESGQG